MEFKTGIVAEMYRQETINNVMMVHHKSLKSLNIVSWEKIALRITRKEAAKHEKSK